MSGHMICFKKSTDLAYFGHNGGRTSMSRKWKVDFCESLGIILIIFEVKPSIQKGVYHTSRQLAPRVIWVYRLF